MEFTPSLIPARLVKRYKRFLADVILDNGQPLTVHCPNTGKMTGCMEAGRQVWLLDSQNPKRKYQYTWELIDTREGLACIHSARANKLVVEALENGIIEEFSDFKQIQTEVSSPLGNSRIDICLQRSAQGTVKTLKGQSRQTALKGRTLQGQSRQTAKTVKSAPEEQCFIEVKSVTLWQPGNLGLFPDTVSERAKRHAEELVELKQQGYRCALIFCAQHSGIETVRPAWNIDPGYSQAVADAAAAGVEFYAYGVSIDEKKICIDRALPVCLEKPI